MSRLFESFDRIPPITKNLLLINVLVYVIMAFAPASKDGVIENYCALHYFSSPLFNPAQLFTYMFLHGGFTHLLFNMFALFMFGPWIEYSMGPKKFLFYYISCGIGAAFVQEGVFAIMLQKYAGMYSPAELDEIIRQGANAMKHGMNFIDPTASKLNMLVNGATVGASGAIYGILLAFGMLFPNQVIYLLIPPMPLKAKWLVLGYGLLELVLGFSGRGDGVAHFCHLGGMIFGVLIILYWKKKGTLHGGF